MIRFTFTTEKDDTKVTKKMTGSMRVGALSKGLLLVNENEVDLVIICSIPPTVALLNSVVAILPEKLKVLIFLNERLVVIRDLYVFIINLYR